MHHGFNLPKNMKRVLVTGGLGHIGSKLIRVLDPKCELFVNDDLSTQRYCSLFNDRDFTFWETG